MTPIALALQGGGALGAITWGVLDRLLEEDTVSFGAVSGASAGAMNAVALAHGWAHGGRDGARAALATFWTAVGELAPSSTAPAAWLAGMTRMFTPQQWNPFDLNPLRDIVTRQFDFDRLRRAPPMRLFVAATQVRSGRLRVFTEGELTPEHLLASACLPALHHPVLIDGEHYWDGGYTANPPIAPLVHRTPLDDLLVVPLLPRERPMTPAGADSIRARVAEIQFGAAFHAEWRELAGAIERARGGWWPFGAQHRLRRLRLHWMDSDLVAQDADVDAALQVGPAQLSALRERGRACADAWWRRHQSALQRR